MFPAMVRDSGGRFAPPERGIFWRSTFYKHYAPNGAEEPARLDFRLVGDGEANQAVAGSQSEFGADIRAVVLDSANTDK